MINRFLVGNTTWLLHLFDSSANNMSFDTLNNRLMGLPEPVRKTILYKVPSVDTVLTVKWDGTRIYINTPRRCSISIVYLDMTVDQLLDVYLTITNTSTDTKQITYNGSIKYYINNIIHPTTPKIMLVPPVYKPYNKNNALLSKLHASINENRGIVDIQVRYKIIRVEISNNVSYIPYEYDAEYAEFITYVFGNKQYPAF